MTHVSPSQIATWRGCQRKWAYSRTRPRTENKFAAFGTRAHTVAELWLSMWQPPDAMTPEGRCILSGIEYLPPPGTNVLVELEARPVYYGVEHWMRIDFLYGYDPGRIVVIGDHKTTGDLKWAKTPAELADDPQRIEYAHWAQDDLDVEYVAAQWIYYQRDGKRALPVTYVEHRDLIKQRFDIMSAREVVPLMIAAERGPIPEELPRSFAHCSAFGGCPYREECWSDMTPAEQAAASMAGALQRRKAA